MVFRSDLIFIATSFRCSVIGYHPVRSYHQQSKAFKARQLHCRCDLWRSRRNRRSKRYLRINCIVLLLCERVPSWTYSQQSTKQDVRGKATASSLLASGANWRSKQLQRSVAVFEVAMWDNLWGLQGKVIALLLWASGTNQRSKRSLQIDWINLLFVVQ